MDVMETNEMRQASNNKSLFQAVAKDDAEKIRRLIDCNFGANVNCEFTIDEMIKDEILDKKAIAILRKSEMTVAKLRKTKKIDAVTDGKLNRYEEVIWLPGLKNTIILSNDSKLSALQVAVFYGRKEAITELIKKGSDPNKALDIQGITVLQLMCTAAVFRDMSCFVFDENIIQLLFDYGADPNIEDVTGRRFLHYAVICGDFLIDETVKSMNTESDEASETIDYYKRIQKFLINGANPNVRHELNLKNILYYIFEHRRYRNIQEELINLLTDSSCTLIHLSLQPLEARGMMLKIDSEIVQKAIGSVSSQANDSRDEDFREKCYQREKKHQELIDAISKRDEPRIRLLLEEGISPNTRDLSGESLLHKAVEAKSIAIIDILIKKGADPNIKNWKAGETPLIIAVRSHSSEVVKQLLEHGAKTDILSAKGYSALYTSLSEEVDRNLLTNLLIDYGASPDTSRELRNLCNATKNAVKATAGEEMHGTSVERELDVLLSKMKLMAPYLRSEDNTVKCVFSDIEEIAQNNNISNIPERINELRELIRSVSS